MAERSFTSCIARTLIRSRNTIATWVIRMMHRAGPRDLLQSFIFMGMRMLLCRSDGLTWIERLGLIGVPCQPGKPPQRRQAQDYPFPATLIDVPMAPNLKSQYSMAPDTAQVQKKWKYTKVFFSKSFSGIRDRSTRKRPTS